MCDYCGADIAEHSEEELDQCIEWFEDEQPCCQWSKGIQ